MKALNWKKILPHIIAVVSFIVIAALFCKPSLEGKTLYQHDIVQYEGGSKDISNYAEKHGKAPLWTNGMFGGMPTYQIWMPANNVLPHYLNKVLTLGLPQPMQFFFLACILFYFLSQVARVNPYVGILGALAFGYSNYNPVIIAAGHVTKMWCIAYMPAILASLMLIYRKKYLLGAGLLALFAATQIGLNHLQISFYTFIILFFYTVACLITWMRTKEYGHMAKALGFTIIAAVIGVMVNSVTLLTTYEYAKETIRGGSLSLKDSASTKGTGLTREYAFSYSYKPMEAFTVMFPRIYGGSDGIREPGEESKVKEAIAQVPRQSFEQLPNPNEAYQRLNNLQSSYWGGLDGTSGPPYFGAIVCFLFIAFLFLVKGETKWWILAATVFTFLISWGKFFPAFNYFLFDTVPLYNKFRAPSVSIVMLQVLWPFAAILALQHIFTKRDDPATWKKLKHAGIAAGGVFLVIFMAYLSLSYTDESTTQLKQSFSTAQGSEPLLNVIKASADDKKAVFLQDIFKSLAITGIFFVILSLYARRKLNKESWVIAAGIFLVLIDLLPVGSTYMNKRANGEDAWSETGDSNPELQMGKADQQILQDKGWYRVLNLSTSPFQDATTSNFHKSIGGYHAAKIGRYQDLAENKLYSEFGLLSTDSTLAMGLNQNKYTGLNMLNTKYIIGANPPIGSNDQAFVIVNPNALGAAWFVKEVRFAPDLKAEMNALNGLDASQTAIVPESEKAKVIAPVYDSAAKIELVSNDNDVVNYKSSASTPQFAVFSEVYYSEGWNAYVDGKKADYVKTNYTLRGMSVPAGNHTIEFKFEPASFSRGTKLTTIAQILVLLLLAGGIFLEYRKRK
jgi:hypothetical protein